MKRMRNAECGMRKTGTVTSESVPAGETGLSRVFPVPSVT